MAPWTTGIVKNLFNNKPDERIKVGRPRLRWLEDGEKDIGALNIKNG